MRAPRPSPIRDVAGWLPAPPLILLGIAAGCAAPAASVRDCPPAPVASCPAASSEAPDARAALERFLNATEARRFEEAYSLLAGNWRARYTPARLADDFSAARGTAQDLLARARAAAARPLRLLEGGARAELAVGDGKAVRLVRELDGWKVESLE